MYSDTHPNSTMSLLHCKISTPEAVFIVRRDFSPGMFHFPDQSAAEGYSGSTNQEQD
jgi:hypothetical protein